jgi:hypothetical protein
MRLNLRARSADKTTAKGSSSLWAYEFAATSTEPCAASDPCGNR